MNSIKFLVTEITTPRMISFFKWEKNLAQWNSVENKVLQYLKYKTTLVLRCSVTLVCLDSSSIQSVEMEDKISNQKVEVFVFHW